MLAVLLGLGTWQVQRLHWKQGLLAQIARAEAAPRRAAAGAARPLHQGARRPVTCATTCPRSYGAEVRDTPAGPELGTQLIVPLERQDGDAILVDRGWVPDKRPHPIAPAEGDVDAWKATCGPATRPACSAPPTIRRRGASTRSTPRRSARRSACRQVAPFILVAMGPPPPERYPDPARHLPRPPNNHLSYAITWYGLAIALVVIFVLWARKVLSA